jgi:hypothetical protein
MCFAATDQLQQSLQSQLASFLEYPSVEETGGDRAQQMNQQEKVRAFAVNRERHPLAQLRVFAVAAAVLALR